MKPSCLIVALALLACGWISAGPAPLAGRSIPQKAGRSPFRTAGSRPSPAVLRSSAAPVSDLSISQSAFPSPTVITDSGVIYTITVKNAGPDPAQSVLVSDNLPVSVNFFSCASTTAGICNGAGTGSVSVSFASLAAGGTAVITIIGVVDCSVSTSTSISNTVTVSSASSDPDPSNNTSTTTVRAFNQPPLISCPDDLTVVAPASQSSIVVEYPPPLIFDKCPGTTVACSPPSGSSFPIGATTVTCTATDSGQATATCAFTVTVKHPTPAGPQITGASISGKRLFVTGQGFDPGAVILINGEEQRTANDDQNPTTSLTARKAGKKIAPGQTVILQVRNADEILSNEFSFTRPLG